MENVQFDTNKPCCWFQFRGIKYNRYDCIVINGEDSALFYGMISKIVANNSDIEVTWFYLQNEMVLSAKERASIHSNEIFYTISKDMIDIETIQMKAPIYLVEKGNKIPKVPREWFVLRRKYDPFKNIMKPLENEKEWINHMPKLSKATLPMRGDMEDVTVDVKIAKSPVRKTVAAKSKVKATLVKPFLNSKENILKQIQGDASSSDDSSSEESTSNSSDSEVEVASTKNVTSGKSPAAKSILVEKQTKMLTPKTVLTKQTSRKENDTLSAASKAIPKVTTPKAKTPVKPKTQVTPKKRSSKEFSTTPKGKTSKATPTTRSGRNIKPVKMYQGLNQSLALEALLKSNIIKKMVESSEASSSCSSDSDDEVSVTKRAPRKSLKKKVLEKKYHLSSDSGEEEEEREKKRKPKAPKTPLAPRKKFLKPASINTPCVIPMRKQKPVDKDAFAQARSRLHVSAVPDTLPCREEQFADIYYFLDSKLEEGTGGCMYISGVPGTGKTATVNDVLKSIADQGYKYQTIEVNGMKISEPKHIYSLIYKHLEGKKVTPDHGALLLGEYFGKHEKQSIVLIVDELDLLWTRKQHVMYNLFDWPNRANSKLVVLAIANTMDLPERMLMNRVASRLGLTRMTFQPYTHKELLEIINSRVVETEAFAPEAVMLAARKVAAASGDARRALDMCRLALDIAEKDSSGLVGSGHIQQSIVNMYHSMRSMAIMNCTMYEKTFLKSVIGVFRRKGVEEAVFKEVYEVFSSLCHFQGLFSPPCSSVLQLCGALGACRILLVEQGHPSLHTHIRLNCSQDDVIFGLKEKADT